MNHEAIFEGLLNFWLEHADETECHWVYSQRLHISDELFLAFKSEEFAGLGTVECIQLYDGRGRDECFSITRIDRPVDGFSHFGGAYYYSGEIKMEGEYRECISNEVSKTTGVDIEEYLQLRT